MESKQHAETNPSPLFQPAQRDARGSLEVFNPSTHNTTAPFRSQPTWRSWAEPPHENNPEPPPSAAANTNIGISTSSSGRPADDKIKSWMALRDPKPFEAPPFVPAVAPPSPGGIVGAAEQRAAEWGLVLKTDSETGKPQGVKVRT